MRTLLLSFVLPASLCGCQSAYFLVNPDKSKTVPAAYGKIGDRRLAVLVWAGPSTLDEYPQARLQVCQAVTYYMKKNLPKARLISARDVEAFQDRSDTDWQGLSNVETCRALGCDLLLKVDLLDFTSRASDSPQLRKARVSATIDLYECGDVEHVDAVYEGDIAITYPPNSLYGETRMNEADLLHGAVEHFAEVTASQFYDHEVKIQDRPRR